MLSLANIASTGRVIYKLRLMANYYEVTIAHVISTLTTKQIIMSSILIVVISIFVVCITFPFSIADVEDLNFKSVTWTSRKSNKTTFIDYT